MMQTDIRRYVMDNEKKALPGRIFGILLSASIILAGLCLMAACAGIYFSGGKEPYSREAVAAAFRTISLPVYLCLGLVAASFLLNRLRPAPVQKPALQKQHSVLLRRAAARADPDACPPEIREQIAAERRLRKKQSRLCALALAFCAGAFLLYALNGSHFHDSDINGSMIRAMVRLVPCLGVSIAVCMATVRSRCSSMARETELLKQCPRKAASEETAPAAPGRARYVLLVIGLGLLAFGYFTGGTADVLTKAVNICTECIGLG